MLNLAEYRRYGELLADRLPWAALVAPGVVLNKDGSFQRSFAFRGPDLESATEAELVAACARLNNVLRRFGSGWALFFDATRTVAPSYPECRFADPTSWLVDRERRAAFEEKGAFGRRRDQFESTYRMTLLYMAPPGPVSRAERALLEVPEDDPIEPGQLWRAKLAAFVVKTDRALDLMQGFLPEIRALDDAETLTYLHGTVSTCRHPVAVPETPMHLDALLADTPLVDGLEPILGDRHLRTITVLGFPNTARPGLLDDLNRLGIAYRWVARWIAIDKPGANRILTRIHRRWFAKRETIAALLHEVLYNEATSLLETDATNKALDSSAALQALGSEEVGFGYLTITVTVSDETRAGADEKQRVVGRAINGRGFATIRETVNAVEAWLSSLPGHVYTNIRQPLVQTRNLTHLVPLPAVWAGPVRNKHLDGPPLLFAETSRSTPFRLSTHVGDVGHMLIVGPIGAGTSVLLALLAMQFRRYPANQIYILDKGGSARASVLAMGGRYHRLENEGEQLAFQPLAAIDEPAERAWAAEWVLGLLAHEGIGKAPGVKDMVWSALGSLASAPVHQRTLTGLSMLLPSTKLKAALAPYTLEGPFGHLLDAAEDRLHFGDIECFETEALMRDFPGAVPPVLTYLFHRLDARFDGSPTLLILDEAWVFLDDPLFSARIREWLKTLRKKNVAVIFATQSLADITDSTIAPAIIESCPQRIFLPNDRAVEPESRRAYERFGLNERQIQLIASAIPKRDYYLQSRLGNRLFELGLGPIALAFCGATSPADQMLIDRLLARADGIPFGEAWLAEKELIWAADKLLLNDPPLLTPRAFREGQPS
ncbi:MAG: conjugal transfer protein TrbE [Rhodospirillales bacterium]|nr:conjugal transfer protein TrbE [Rhodospirillales bacterium]